MELNNDITDNFADSSYQFNEYKFNKDFQELLCNQYLTESDSNASLDWLDAVPSGPEDDAVSKLSVPIYSDKGEHFGGFRSKDFSELNKEPQDFYYD